MSLLANRIGTHIRALGDELGTCNSLYVGGGTPSVLPRRGEGSLESLLQTAHAVCPDLAEITLEANPESADDEFLAVAADQGVTRVSLGVQSLDGATLRGLGRRGITDPYRLRSRVEEIRHKWGGDLGVDLIHAGPQSTHRSELTTIGELLDIGPDHISFYDLSVEPGTPLANRVSPASLRDTGEGWPELVGRIEKAGLPRYEVSNFARPGHECAHNQAYWRGEDYVGLGPSAVTTVTVDGTVQRITQTTRHDRFLEQSDPLAGGVETLSPADVALERVLLGLRTAEGISSDDLHRLAADENDVAGLEAVLARLTAEGLVRESDARVRATSLGLDLLNRVLTAIMEACRAVH